MGLLEALGAALLAIVGAFLFGRRKGAQAAKQQAKEADHDRATKIEDAADRARAAGGGDAVDRLRQAGRLRD